MEEKSNISDAAETISKCFPNDFRQAKQDNNNNVLAPYGEDRQGSHGTEYFRFSRNLNGILR